MFKHNLKRTNELCIQFLRKSLQRFASKTLQNDSNSVEKIHSRFYSTYMCFLNRFGVRILANVQQKLNSYSSRLLKNFLQTSVGNRLKSVRKMPKKIEIFVDFRHFQ